jgi:hypothetical protein
MAGAIGQTWKGLKDSTIARPRWAGLDRQASTDKPREIAMRENPPFRVEAREVKAKAVKNRGVKSPKAKNQEPRAKSQEPRAKNCTAALGEVMSRRKHRPLE